MNDAPHNWRWWRIDLTGLLVCVGLTALVYTMGIHPQFARQVEADRARQQLLSKENKANGLVNQLTELKRGLATIQQQLEASPLRLMPAKAINQKIAHLAKLAEVSGLKINQVQPGQPLAGKHYSTVPIRLIGTGRFSDVVSFLHKLHGGFKDIGVGSWSVSGDPSAPGSPAEFAFGLSWFAAPTISEKIR